jgi:hypothetical protein
MALYAVIKGEIVDGIAVRDESPCLKPNWICVDGMDPMPGPYWTYKDGVFTPPVIIPPPALPNIITKLAMIDRFAEAEYEGILTAAKTDIQVQGWLDRFNVSNQINLEDSRTISGIDLLVSKNLLTQERADEILTAPVQDSERP